MPNKKANWLKHVDKMFNYTIRILKSYFGSFFSEIILRNFFINCLTTFINNIVSNFQLLSVHIRCGVSKGIYR